MKKLWRRLKPCVVLLTCWGLLLAPVQVQAGAIVKVEVDDAAAFRTEMRQFLTGQGLESPQMQEFLEAPKKEWRAILDRFEKEFGFPPSLIDTLCTGQVSLEIHQDGLMLGVLHKDEASAGSFLTELAKLLDGVPQVKAEITTTEGGSKLRIPMPEGAFLMEAAGRRVVIAGGADEEAVQSMAEEFLAGKARRLADREDLPAELRGPGLIMMQAPPMAPVDKSSPGPLPLSPQVQEMLGFSTPQFTRVYFDDDDMMMTSYVTSRKGLFQALYLPGPVSEQALAWLPAECQFAAAYHVQPSQFIPMLLEIEKKKPIGITMALQIAIGSLGFNPQDDLLAHVGDEIVLGQLPMKRGGGFPLISGLGLGSSYAVVNLKDPEAFGTGLEGFLTVLGALAAADTVGGGVKRTRVGDVPVSYLRVGSGAISPCFAIKGNNLVVTSNIPLMRYLLEGHGTWEPITTDRDFQKNLALLGGELTSFFSYTRHQPQQAGAGSTETVLLSVAVVSILAAMLLPALSKARGRAREVSDLSMLKQVGLAMFTFQMDNEDRFPKDLKELVPTYLTADSFEGQREVIHYCPPEGTEVQSQRPLAYSRSRAREGLNILFGDGHVEFCPTDSEKHTAALALEAIPLEPGEKPAEEPAPPALESPLNPDKLGRFALAEARNLGRTIDFALFPSMAEFSREGSSNIGIMEVREHGLLSMYKMGQMGQGEGNIMVAAAVVGLLAAIAIPNFVKARQRALEHQQMPE